MSNKIEIRLIKDTEIQAAIDFDNNLNKSNRNLKQFLWEHKNNPNGASVFGLLFDQNKIIGTQSMIPILLRNEKRSFKSSKSETSLLHPQWQH